MEENLLNVTADMDEYGEPIEQADQTDQNPAPVDNKPAALDEDVDDIEFDDEEDDAGAQADPVEDEPEEEEKQTQSPEDNAYFAQLRRERQEAERKAAEDKAFQDKLANSPEYQLTQFLSKQYGLTPEELVNQMQQSQLQQQAEAQGVPVEFLQKMQQTEQQAVEAQERLNRMEFENWYNRQQSEASKLLEKYDGVLTQPDVDQALSYMLNDLKSTNVPLDSVIRMVHGEKIENHLREMAKQEALAEISGRKQNPLAQNGGKPVQTETLSPEEAHIARMMGVSEKDYLKYRN